MNYLKFTASEDPIVPEPGIYENVPFEEYLRWNCFSKSMVGAALKSGKRLEHFINKGKDTAAMRLGSLSDCLILEPDKFDSTYAVQPSYYEKMVTKGRGENKVTTTEMKPWNNNSKSCQEMKRNIEASGKCVITGEELATSNQIRKAVMSNAEAAASINGGKKQVSACWLDPDTGIPCKCRFDILGDEYIDDLKTANDASLEEFQRTIGKFWYFVQAGVYTQAYEILTGDVRGFRFIVAETGGHTEIPEVALYEISENSILAGRVVWNTALKRAAEWMEYGVQGYSKFWEPIDGPFWQINRILEEYEGEGTV